MHTLFFDFGNVLGYFDNHIAVRQFVRHCDLDEAACFAALYDTALEDDFECGRIGADEFIRRSCAAIKYRGTPAQFRATFQDIFRPNPAVCDLIPRLARQYRLVLASNTNEIHSAQFRKTFADVLRHFAALGLSHEAGARKPQRRFFEHCQTLAGCRPEECLFIDDLPANVAGARAFGWQAIQYADHAEFLGQLRKLGIDVCPPSPQNGCRKQFLTRTALAAFFSEGRADARTDRFDSPPRSRHRRAKGPPVRRRCRIAESLFGPSFE